MAFAASATAEPAAGTGSKRREYPSDASRPLPEFQRVRLPNGTIFDHMPPAQSPDHSSTPNGKVQDRDRSSTAFAQFRAFTEEIDSDDEARRDFQFFNRNS